MKRFISALTLSLFVMGFSGAAFADAAAEYKKNCAKCHGDDGKGQTKMGQKLGAKDWTDAAVQAKFSDADAKKVIEEGAKVDGKTKMKGFKGKVDADALVKFVRAFKK